VITIFPKKINVPRTIQIAAPLSAKASINDSKRRPKGMVTLRAYFNVLLKGYTEMNNLSSSSRRSC